MEAEAGVLALPHRPHVARPGPRGRAAAPRGCPSRTAPGGPAPRRGRGRGSAPPTIASIRSVRLRSSGPRTRGRRARRTPRGRRRGSRPAAPARRRRGARRSAPGARRRPPAPASRSKPGMLRPEPRPPPSPSSEITIAGRWWRSTRREATIPITPGCQPSPASDQRRAPRAARRAARAAPPRPRRRPRARSPRRSPLARLELGGDLRRPRRRRR